MWPFDVKARHAGKSFHAGQVNTNDCSIGIELDNTGELQAWGDRYYSKFRAGIFSRSGVHDGRRGGRDTGFYRGQFGITEEICSLLKRVLQDQVLGETLGYHPSKDGSGSGVSLR